MSPKDSSPKRKSGHPASSDPRQRLVELQNSGRNERQKTMLLNEVAKIRCVEVARAVERCGQALDQARKSCPPAPTPRKRAG
jgi:hypothetical protein